MLSSVEFFKDETLQGISRSIKQLHQMQAEADSQKMDKFGITNNNQHFRNLLHYVDAGLSLGLIEPKKGYWPLMKKFCHKTTVQLVQSHHDAMDQIKRGQIWLFLTFIESSLASYIKIMRSNEKQLKSFYKKYALLRDTERCTIFEQLIIGLEMVVFVLDFSSPLACFSREPFFKPTEFYASKKAAIPSALPAKISSGTQTPPDVTIVDGAIGTEKLATPDLLRGKFDGEARLSDQKQADSDDELVQHLRTRRNKERSRTKSKKKYENEDSTSISNELEEDNYIPEDSVPIKVVVPDVPNSNDVPEKTDPDLTDENVYQDFLFGMKGLTNKRHLSINAGEGLNLDQEISSASKDTSCDDPRVASPENQPNQFSDGDHEVVLASSVHSEGAYRITYVSDGDDDDDDHDVVGLHETRKGRRSLSLDSFDKFCRSGSVGKEDRNKRRSEYDDDDDDEDGIDAISPGTEAVEDTTIERVGSLDISVDSDAIATSPISEFLPKESIDKVLNARFDTSSGILLPSLPRRPTFSDACEVYHDINVDKNKIVLLSLDIFEESNEILKKMFNLYIGYLYGIRKQVSIAISNLNFYVLSETAKSECGYVKEFSIPLDSVNKIKSGMNMQDVLIIHDAGKLQLWTGEEVLTKNICMTLSTCLRTEKVKTVSTEQMKIEACNDFELLVKDWMMFIEKVEEPEIMHFALVEFYAITNNDHEQKVVKSGHLHRKLNYLGMVPYWETSIFGLRGSSLYEYSQKGNHELRQVLDLGRKCGGCVRVKTSDKLFGFRVLGTDGATPLLELAAESEDEANDWIVNICQAVADAKHSRDTLISDGDESVSPRGLLLSSNKIYLLIKNSRTRKLSLVDSCMIRELLRICVDNEDRTYCVLQIDDSIGSYVDAQKRSWVLKFQSEFELGKFEQKVFAIWHSLYQVPLQFVLLADNNVKKSIKRFLSFGKQDSFALLDDTAKSVLELSSL